MEFLHVDSDNPSSPIDSLRVNWYYRPRDVQRFNSDTRLVYATMHSDMCPLTSLRGKCMIKHRSEIESLDEYRKHPDSFYFVQVFDRFIRRWYECIPTAQIINVPEKVKKALDERWKFVVVEIGRVKELTSAVKTCKRCARYCATNDSVDCAICKNSYHMNCVQPPLPKKPSRGFAWACGPCSRASERQLEARNTPTLSGNVTEAEEEEMIEDEKVGMSNDTTRAPSPTDDDMVIDDHPATQAEIAMAKMWPMRYLGIHCRVEDALQYDDRAIYPRASSRLGPRHQANVNVWHGRPVELVKPAEIKKRFVKNTSHKKDGKFAKETVAALEADRAERAKRPSWVVDEPPGYIARGEEYANDDPKNTAKLMFKMPPQGVHSERGMDDKPSPFGKEAVIDAYMAKAKPLARKIAVPPFGINFLDKALELLTANNYNSEIALKQLEKIDRVKDLHEPVLSKGDLTKFEEGVAKYGSEHRLIRLHMKTSLSNAEIVRFYYLWKKTPKGREIWGNYPGRKGKKKVDNDAAARLHLEVTHDVDDSAFDGNKAAFKKQGFQCKFCGITHARQWRRAPGVATGQTVLADAKSSSKDKRDRLMVALCLRCAHLWRKYAIQWEDLEEVAKKVAQGGGRAWKKRIDEELLRELQAANELAGTAETPEPPAATAQVVESTGEPAKKKAKTGPTVPVVPEPPKIEEPPPPPKEPTPPPPPIIPVKPQWRILPCAVCKGNGNTIECAHCRLTVHRVCFGIKPEEGLRPNGEVNWVCEQCQNDKTPSVSTDYTCCLCLTEETLIDLVEPPKVSHKKKTDREREKERMEKELAEGMRAEHINKQLNMNRPIKPREPLKRTTGNNWVHVYCAVWTPEIRFSDAAALEVAEGFQQIPPSRHEAVCKLCKNKDHAGLTRSDKGTCVSCFQCSANFHASCAFEAGYTFGFDVTPVKGSRKDANIVATLGAETGLVQPAIWCKEHTVKTVIHWTSEIANETADPEAYKTNLQVYAENYKQADLTLTGTVRKANLAQLTKDKGQQVLAPSQSDKRRESTANSIAAAVRRGARNSSVAETKKEDVDGTTDISELQEASAQSAERRCAKCNIDVTPRWHAIEAPSSPSKEPTPPRSPPRRMSITLGEIADQQRERTAEVVARPQDASDTTGAPAVVQQSEPSRPAQNIRFMVPGTNGRAWDGMLDRYGNRTRGEGESLSSEGPISNTVAPSTEGPAPQTNGEPRPPQTEPLQGETDDGYHAHGLPQYQNPASAPTPPLPEPEAVAKDKAQEFWCHKCFLKKKLDPTPPPPDSPVRPELSPPTQLPIQIGYQNQPPQLQPQTVPFSWDERARQHQVPPPTVNGHVPSPSLGPHIAPHTNHGFGPYGQPNGFHGPPPSSQPPQASTQLGPRPPVHDRVPSYGYQGQPSPNLGYQSQPSPNPPPYRPQMPHRPPSLNGFPPASQPLPNGMASPHVTQQAPLQSPTYLSGPPHHQYQPPRSTESPFASQLPPIGVAPAHGSPSASFTRLESLNGTASQPAPPHHQATQTPQPGQQFQQPLQQASPQTTQARPESQLGRPTTPRDGQSNGAPTVGTVSGASTSPNLRNLMS